MDILGPLPRTKQGNQSVVVMTDRYAKLTSAIPTSKTNGNTVAYIFLEHCMENYGIKSSLFA